MKYHGPVRWIFRGKKETCAKHTSRARLYLMQAISRMGPDMAAWNRVEPDGTLIRISSFTSGYNVEITCPEARYEYSPCVSGFYLEPTSDEAPLGFRDDPDQTPIEAGDGFFPGITLVDGDIIKTNIERTGAQYPYTLDWTAPGFTGYLVWPANRIGQGTDDNGIDWEIFHRYACTPANGDLYYCNTVHSSPPSGQALGYAVRTINKQQFLYAVCTTDTANLDVYRRVWTETPYENNDEINTNNPLGWEFIGTVAAASDKGFDPGCTTSGAYFNTDADRFVVSFCKGYQDIPRGYIEVFISATGVITYDSSNLLEFDDKNSQFKKNYDPTSWYDLSDPLFTAVGDNIQGTSCPHGSTATYNTEFETRVRWTDATGTHTETYKQADNSYSFHFNRVYLGADYNYETGERVDISQNPIEAYGGTISTSQANGGYTTSITEYHCSPSCALYEITKVFNYTRTRIYKSDKLHNFSLIYPGVNTNAYHLSFTGGQNGTEYWGSGTAIQYDGYWVKAICGEHPNATTSTGGSRSLNLFGTIEYNRTHILYLDLRYNTYITVKGHYITHDGGLNYYTTWTLDINGDVQEVLTHTPGNTITSSDGVIGCLVSEFGNVDGATRNWDFNALGTYSDDAYAWHNLGKAFTDKNGHLIVEIPEYSLTNELYWPGAVQPSTTKRLYYTPYGFETLETLGYSGTNLGIAHLQLV